MMMVMMMMMMKIMGLQELRVGMRVGLRVRMRVGLRLRGVNSDDCRNMAAFDVDVTMTSALTWL